jgi:cytidine deaminase
MSRIAKHIIERAINKAKQSTCRYLISAVGINHGGEVVFSAVNTPRFSRPGGGNHAEMIVLLRAGPGLKSIVLCRVSRNGGLRKIHPCGRCLEKARELGVRIYGVVE